MAKRDAYDAIMSNHKLKHFIEFYDETIFQFDSVEDFIESLNPRKNLENISTFLIQNNFLLNADRRVTISQSL